MRVLAGLQIVLLLFIVGDQCVVIIVSAILWLPRHLVLLLQAPTRVRKPSRDLSQRHLGDNGQHDLLALGGVRILLVLVEPRLQCGRRLTRGILTACGQVVAGAIAEMMNESLLVRAGGLIWLWSWWPVCIFRGNYSAGETWKFIKNANNLN